MLYDVYTEMYRVEVLVTFRIEWRWLTCLLIFAKIYITWPHMYES